MRATQHTVVAQPRVKFRVPGLEDLEAADPLIEITFDYVPGRPAFTPRGEYAPIDPPDPPEVSFVSAKLIDGDGLDPPASVVKKWALDWLDSDEGYCSACEAAESEPSGPDPDAWYDAKRNGDFDR